MVLQAHTHTRTRTRTPKGEHYYICIAREVRRILHGAVVEERRHMGSGRNKAWFSAYSLNRNRVINLFFFLQNLVYLTLVHSLLPLMQLSGELNKLLNSAGNNE